jgi:hypothetical protein
MASEIFDIEEPDSNNRKTFSVKDGMRNARLVQKLVNIVVYVEQQRNYNIQLAHCEYLGLFKPVLYKSNMSFSSFVLCSFV